MDALDRQLVKLLQSDAKLGYQQLGEAVGLSGAAAYQRVRKLELGGVVTGYHAAIDPQKAGRPVIAYLLVRPRDTADVEHLLERWASADEIEECHLVTGAAGYRLKLRLRSVGDLEAHIEAARASGCDPSAEVVVATRFERRPIPVP